MAIADRLPTSDETRLNSAGEARIAGFRQILASGQWTWIEGVPVELQTAKQVVDMHDNLSPLARDLYRRLHATRMVDLAWEHARQQALTRSRRR